MTNLIKKVNKIARKDGRQTKTPTNLSLKFLELLSKFLMLILKKKIIEKESAVLINTKKQTEAISIRILKRFLNIEKKILIKKRQQTNKFSLKFLRKEKCGKATIVTSVMMMKNTTITIMIITMKTATIMTMATMIITTTIIMSHNII